MKILVTGASGFLGQHILEALDGRDVADEIVALSRRASDDPRFVAGDLLDTPRLIEIAQGCEVVIHAAGLVRHDTDAAEELHRAHVVGTASALRAASAVGARRFVHLSTSGTIAVSEEADVVSNEDSPPPQHLIQGWPYYRTKLYAEQLALAARDLEVICLNPSLLLGPGDARGSSTDAVARFLDDQVPVCPAGGLSFADVRDVASTVVAALERGQPGERYLLGAANMSFSLFYERLGRIADRQPPRLRAPRSSAGWLRWLPAGSKLPALHISREEAELAAHTWYLDDRKARTALGWAPRDPMLTLAETVDDLLLRRVGAR